MDLNPAVIAELKAERAERQRKAEEARIDSRVQALDRRLIRLEAEPRGNPAPAFPDEFWAEVTAAFRSYVDIQIGRLKNENEALRAQIKFLMEQPTLEYKGVYDPGTNYLRNSLVTHEGSLWIARVTTGSAPGNPGGSHWKLCCKRGKDGRDGKDGKDWRETAPAKGW